MENQIFNEDCLETMSRMSSSIDLVVTRPILMLGAVSTLIRRLHGSNEGNILSVFRVLKS